MSQTEESESLTIVCDACDKVYHLHCIGLVDVPDGDYVCPICIENLGITDGENKEGDLVKAVFGAPSSNTALFPPLYTNLEVPINIHFFTVIYLRHTISV